MPGGLLMMNQQTKQYFYTDNSEHLNNANIYQYKIKNGVIIITLN
jgi:hypothetical protein